MLLKNIRYTSLIVAALFLGACSQEQEDKPLTSVQQKVKQLDEEAQNNAATTEPKVINQPSQSKQANEVASPSVSKQASGQQLYATCVGCHGSEGEGGVGPKLAGQTAHNIAELLKRYKAGEEVGPMTMMMAPNATQLSDADIMEVSKYIANF